MCYFVAMDEEAIVRQIQQHMAAQGISQADLGRLVVPDSKNGRQTVHQYLTGRRSLMTGTARAILDALGLEVVIRPKQAPK